MKHQYVVTFDMVVHEDELDPGKIMEKIELNVNSSNFNIESTLENIEYLGIDECE